jgi:hypothetical protein
MGLGLGLGVALQLVKPRDLNAVVQQEAWVAYTPTPEWQAEGLLTTLHWRLARLPIAA